MMRKHGLDLSTVNARGSATLACDELWFMQAVATKIGGAPLTVGNFMAGANALGFGYTSPTAYGVHLSASQHDGITDVRNMRFVGSCNCFRYSSSPYRI